jgi:S-formylglutathione hydrolase FrmB
LFLLLWFSKSVTAQSAEAAAQIHVILDGSVVEKPVSGRLLVLFSKKSNPAPMMGPDWFSPEPFVALYVRDAQPGQNILVTDAADGFPSRLSTLPPGRYFVQAVLNRNPEFSNHKDGPGNLYSPIASVVVRSNQPVSATLRLNSKIEPTNYNETHLARVFSRRSKLLSDFHHREVKDRALVLLPPSYVSNPDKRYPVYYEITGFGATIKDLLGYHKQSEVAAGGVEFIHVMLTGQCQWGHHVYADSATNGPRSAALVEELIPAIDREFRTIAKPEARFLGGHSSGGWASLWLQIKHPTKFAGVWSTAPDPVDFRDWQGTNLYEADANVYRTVSGDRKPLARHGTRTLLWYDEFTKMDDVLGRGGQIRSFDAVFSPLETTGAPARCWNRQSGAVNQEIAEAWKQFDISRILLENWEALKGPLEGKIHVFMGTDDTFLLTRAAELLAERLDELGSDAQFEFIQGRNHFDLVDPLTRDRIHREIAERFLKTN